MKGRMWFESAQVELVRDAFPEWMAFLFATLSYLGSVWFVAPVVVLAYWFRDRHRFASWIGIVMGGYAVMLGLKSVFATPRPDVGPAIAPETLPPVLALLYAPAVEVGTTSFPSGHAIAGTVVWTMLALEFDAVTNGRSGPTDATQSDGVGRRLAGAAAVVGLVSFARVGAGIHYPIDVIAGVAVGVCYVAVTLAIRNRARTWGRHVATSTMFAMGAVLSIVTFWIGGQPDTMALFGGCIGALLAWQYATPPREPWPVTWRVLAHATAGIAALATVALVLLVVDSAVVWLAVGFTGGVIVVGLPRFVGHATVSSIRREVTG